MCQIEHWDSRGAEGVWALTYVSDDEELKEFILFLPRISPAMIWFDFLAERSYQSFLSFIS